MKKLSLVFALLALSACAAKPVKLTTAFDEVAAEKQMKDGKNTVVGSAVWQQKNGTIMKCSGHYVYMYPATKYAEERVQHLFGGGSNGSRGATREKVVFAPDKEAFHRLSRKAPCDVDGKFKFKKVADGDYYLKTDIIWGDPEYPDDQTEGGSLMKKINVDGGRKIKVVLSPYL